MTDTVEKSKEKLNQERKDKGCSSVGRASHLHCEGRGFNSSSSTSKKDDFIERLKEHSKRFGNTSLTNNQWKLEESKKHTIAPAYNKGAYQVIPRNEVKDIGK